MTERDLLLLARVFHKASTDMLATLEAQGKLDPTSGPEVRSVIVLTAMLQLIAENFKEEAES